MYNTSSGRADAALDQHEYRIYEYVRRTILNAALLTLESSK